MAFCAFWTRLSINYATQDFLQCQIRQQREAITYLKLGLIFLWLIINHAFLSEIIPYSVLCFSAQFAKKSSPRKCSRYVYGAIKWPSYITLSLSTLHALVQNCHKSTFILWEIFAWLVLAFCSKLRKVSWWFEGSRLLLCCGSSGLIDGVLVFFCCGKLAETSSFLLFVAGKWSSEHVIWEETISAFVKGGEKEKGLFSEEEPGSDLLSLYHTRNRGNKLPWHKHVLYRKVVAIYHFLLLQDAISCLPLWPSKGSFHLRHLPIFWPGFEIANGILKWFS